MTREDVLAMEPGREMDALVAKVIFGVEPLTLEEAVKDFSDSHAHIFLSTGCFVNKNTELAFNYTQYDAKFGRGYHIPTRDKWLLENAEVETSFDPYSKDIRAAWEVVEKATDYEGFSSDIGPDGMPNYHTWTLWFGPRDACSEGQAGSYKAPEAICKAALIARLGL